VPNEFQYLPQISAVIVNNEETRVRDHLSGKNYKYEIRILLQAWTRLSWSLLRSIDGTSCSLERPPMCKVTSEPDACLCV
jgi:hypothetical protein